jgi:hypothetical protein
MRKRLMLLGLPLLVVVFACSKSKTPATVSGKVTYKGETVPGGILYFYSLKEDGSPGAEFSCVIKSDGTYSSSQLPEGDLLVSIDTESKNPNSERAKADPSKYGKGTGKGAFADPKMMMEQMKKNNNVPDMPSDDTSYLPIPKKYWEPATSGLKVTLKAGKNTFDFNLTD